MNYFCTIQKKGWDPFFFSILKYSLPRHSTSVLENLHCQTEPKQSPSNKRVDGHFLTNHRGLQTVTLLFQLRSSDRHLYTDILKLRELHNEDQTKRPRGWPIGNGKLCSEISWTKILLLFLSRLCGPVCLDSHKDLLRVKWPRFMIHDLALPSHAFGDSLYLHQHLHGVPEDHRSFRPENPIHLQ